MKVLKLVIVLAIPFMMYSFMTNSRTVEATEKLESDYVQTIENCDLTVRFEMQFDDLLKDVIKVDVHYNDINEYYYAVYGFNQKEEKVVELFKTTAYEVENEMYNYIEMSTVIWSHTQYCYEANTYAEMNANGWCARNNTSVRCGFWNASRGSCCTAYF